MTTALLLGSGGEKIRGAVYEKSLTKRGGAIQHDGRVTAG